MARFENGLFGRVGVMTAVSKWRRALRNPEGLEPQDLRSMAKQIRHVRDDVDQMAAGVQSELLKRVGAGDGIDRPDQCDWAERAQPWRTSVRPRGHGDVASPTTVGGGVTLFHDATRAEMSLRQDRTPDHIKGPLFGLVLEVYRFDGSFVSLVQDLPAAALIGLTRNHYIAVRLTVEREQPVEIYARLNIQHGPNTETLVRQVDIRGDAGLAEFDLAYSKINEKRLEKAWLDLIIENPAMNRVALWDMVMLRAPRADL